MNPNSALTTYLTVPQFILGRDVRSIYQYSTDLDKDPVLNGPIPGMVAVLSNPNTPVGQTVLFHIQAASGMLESAVFRSNIYTVLDIQNMLATNSNSAFYCRKILCDLAMYNLITRRPGPNPPDTVLNAYNEAIKALNDLSIGVRIFAFAETEAAGLPQTNQFSANDWSNNDLITQRWGQMFGSRQINKRYTPNSRGFQ